MEPIVKTKDGMEILFSFLRRTAQGEYAPIEESSLPYSRMEVETETIEYCEEGYYYSFG